jgi:hypothetical protein
LVHWRYRDTDRRAGGLQAVRFITTS